MLYQNKSKDELLKILLERDKEIQELSKQNSIIQSYHLESENRFKMLVDNNPAAIAVHSGGVIQYVNKQGLHLLGATKSEEVIGQSVLKFLHPSSIAAVKTRIEKMATNPNFGIKPIEEKYIRLDGQVIDLEVSAFPVMLKKQASILVVLIDITARKKIEEDRRKLSQSVEQSPNIVVITDKDGNIEYVNRKFTEVTSYTLDEVKGLNPSVLKSGYTKLKDYEKLWESIKSGKEWRGEFLNIKKEGELYWEAAHISPLLNEKGEITHYVAIKEDITQHKKNLAEIRKLSQVVETTSQGVVIADTGGIIGYVNKGLLQLMGYENSEDLIGHDMLEFTDREGENTVKNHLLPDLLKYGKWSGELNVKRKDGSLIPCDDTCSLIVDEKGNAEYYVAIFNDISQRKAKEQELQQAVKAAEKSEKKYRELFEAVEEGIIRVDAQENIVLLNNAGAHIFGYEREELVGINLVKLIPKESFPKIEEETENRKNKNTSKYEINIIRKDKSRGVVSVTANPIFKGKRYAGALGIVIDITEKKKIEADLIQAKEKAEESDKLKSAFLATVSHELRTPLNAVLGFSQLILDEETKSRDINHYTEIIQSSGNHLLHIIEDILDISIIESGEMVLHPGETNLLSLLDNIHNILQSEIQLVGKQHVSLISEIPEDKEQFLIYADQSKIKQILINLLKNAIKFTDQGSIHFGFAIENKQIIFHVKDTGIGIPKAQHQFIFDQFRQVENSHTREHGGTGLGLTISKKLVDLLNGKLWFESEPGKGSIFYFSIPYNHTEKNKSVPQTKHLAPDWKGKTIVVAEDENICFDLIDIYLKNTKVNLIHAQNGQEAVNICQTTKQVDLVLMDIRMPIMNGMDATKLIKEMKPDLPIIAQTAYAMASEKKEIMKSGFDDYLSKPLNKEILLKSLQQFLK